MNAPLHSIIDNYLRLNNYNPTKMESCGYAHIILLEEMGKNSTYNYYVFAEHSINYTINRIKFFKIVIG